jgi:hypothetical protein
MKDEVQKIFVNELISLTGVSEQYANAAYSTLSRTEYGPISFELAARRYAIKYNLLKENNPMKTKLEILKQISVVDPVTSKVLEQAIAALENPLGVLPGDEIEVWCDHHKIKCRGIFSSFCGSRSNPWETMNGSWTYARIPVTTEDVTFHNVDVKMLEQQRKDLDFVLARQPDGVAKDAILGIREMLDAWADERDKS